MPKKIDFPPNLLLIPFSPLANLFNSPEQPRVLSHMGSLIKIHSTFSLITGFMGYTHLLTLLDSIPNIQAKNVYFLGTAGAIKQSIDHPSCLNITQIWSSSIYRFFSRTRFYSLNPFPERPYSTAKGVSVDVPMRENLYWLKEQQALEIDVVEMELFPLRVYLKKPFYALVVVTDQIDRKGIHPFPQRDRIRELFAQAFQYMLRWLNEK